MFGGKDDKKQLEERVNALTEENRQLRRKMRLLTGNEGNATLSMASMSGYLTQSGKRPKSLTPESISGLDVGYLVVDREMRIIQINSKMAAMLGCDKKVASKKQALSEVDVLTWAPQVLTTLLTDARMAGDDIPAEFEAGRDNVDGGGKKEYFHFKATWSNNTGTVTAENITQLKTTRIFFEKLVSPNIVTQLLDSSEDPFRVDKRVMTVLFGDLRSFTKFCDAAAPEAVREVFNDFFHLCMQAIDRNHATLDKFVGDQVMALFSAPVTEPGHAFQAIRVAVEIQQAMRDVRQRWIEKGLVPRQLLAAKPDVLKLGIGINTGEMIVGMFGSERSNQYTVLGHHVNLA
ncbi:MAG: adenylate/guanylate cyclase domain-containing protein, partial [Planctomycetes bacterium]|nr:adenylate/guanylate cyclase domain-containing protein [Planctomycetota bacterium]